jgi:hypothetical protein
MPGPVLVAAKVLPTLARAAAPAVQKAASTIASTAGSAATPLSALARGVAPGGVNGLRAPLSTLAHRAAQAAGPSLRQLARDTGQDMLASAARDVASTAGLPTGTPPAAPGAGGAAGVGANDLPAPQQHGPATP